MSIPRSDLLSKSFYVRIFPRRVEVSLILPAENRGRQLPFHLGLIDSTVTSYPGGPTRYVSRITGDSGTPRQIGLLRQSVAKAVCKDTHESLHFASRKRADPTRLVTIRQSIKSSYLDHCLPYYTGSLRQS